MKSPLIMGLSLLSLLLSGCAANEPRYSSSFQYIFPTDEASKNCASQCTEIQSACQQQCSKDHQACLQTVQPQVDKALADAQEQYERDLFAYRNARDDYEILLMRLEYARKNNLMSEMYPLFNPPIEHHLGRSRYLTDYEKMLFNPYIEKPMPPMEPVHERIVDQVQGQCPSECGCEKSADICFLGCGAQKVEETRCIANCPATVSESATVATEPSSRAQPESASASQPANE